MQIPSGGQSNHEKIFGSQRALSALFLPLNAQAQGVYDWSGAYFGIKGGGAIDGTANQANAFVAGGDYDVDGFLVGIMSGYNLQRGNIVFGIDSDSSFADIDGSNTSAACGGTCTSEIDYLGTTRLRAGYAMDRFLPYITGGVASALVDGTYGGASMSSEFHFGFAAGGGLEWAIMDGWSARAEYLYIDLQDKGHSFGPTRMGVDIDDMHVIRAGVSMNVGWVWDAVLGR